MLFYVMNRLGTFVPKHSTNNQCKDVGHETYYYHVTLAFPNDNLDSNGWLIDHNDIDSTINKKRADGSCEEMTKTIVNALLKQFDKPGHAQHPVCVKVKVTAENPSTSHNAAWMTAFWCKSDEYMNYFACM